MKKSEEMLRMERDLNAQPELQKKLEAECKRITEAGEAQSDGDVMVQAAAALGYTITLEELERAAASVQELDPDELDAAGGMKLAYITDEHGHDGWCWAAWHCYGILRHTSSTTPRLACWSNFDCQTIRLDYYTDGGQYMENPPPVHDD